MKRAVLLLSFAFGCTDAPLDDMRGVQDLGLLAVAPSTLLPMSRIVVAGDHFLPEFAGASNLYLEGELAGQPVAVALPLSFVDYQRLEGLWPGGIEAGLGAEEGTFVGTATVEVDSDLDGAYHHSAPLAVTLHVRRTLTPRLDMLEDSVAHVNDALFATGDGFLLGGAEGRTHAVFEGCFTRTASSECAPVGPSEVAAEPVEATDRTRVRFPFSPKVAGIEPGTFTGTVFLRNRHPGGVALDSAALAASHSIAPPVITGFSPAVASLGQFVDISGGGFVGHEEGDDTTLAVTTIELEGSFTPDGAPQVPASVTVVPAFVAGPLLRYVLNEEDDLGTSIDLRSVAGTFAGTARPRTQYGTSTVIGAPTGVVFGIGYVRQVVWLRFLPSYVESLRHFGLRAADALIRERVKAVVERDFAGVNLEVRTTEPVDFALFSEVEIGGPDPNGVGLFGYDNTPGKDDGNLRLHDKIGGVNALTQLDGFPGYGGIFVESFFAFSEHPGALAQPGEGHPLFDVLFDPFRPGIGRPAEEEELQGLPEIAGACPGGDRSAQLACAIFALGSLVGTTASHEIAHALGLADPGGPAFHNEGDLPGALMDAGPARTFLERVEIGEGPAVFCRQNYDYLRVVLPTHDPDPHPDRIACQ